MLFFGVNGAQGNQWGNSSSFQCVVPPVKRTPLQSSGGNAGFCDGSFSLDFNAWAWSNPSRAPEAGSTVWMQAWYRDPANTSNQTTSLSQGWQFVFQP